jgi:hypothetical protein
MIADRVIPLELGKKSEYRYILGISSSSLNLI